MRLTVDHSSTYTYEHGVSYALQQVRKRPITLPSQSILSWDVSIEGAHWETSYTDHHGNLVDLIQLEPDVMSVSVSVKGEVETHDTSGVMGGHSQLVPLWLYQRPTELTMPAKGLRALAGKFSRSPSQDIGVLHELMVEIADKVAYRTNETDSRTTAEDALQQGQGVCQDHAHIFITVARLLGYPARYVSGYLMMTDRVDQDAGHAWAEAWVDGLGWTGFDVSNGISPDARYIQVATGLDYSDAAPIRGLVYGAGAENLVVSIQVQQ